MITERDLINIIENKIAGEIQKNIIRSNLPPQIASKMCDAIDTKDASDRASFFFQAFQDWMIAQQCQQEIIQRVFTEYFK